MGRGFLAGIFWGGIVGLAILFIASQSLDRVELSLPKPEASAVEVPAGTEFDQAREETDPVVPEAETRPMSDAVSGVAVPEDAVETTPTFDTSALEIPQPTVDAPGGLGEVPKVAEELEIDVTGPGPEQTGGGESPTLTSPEAPATAPETSTEAPAAVESPSAEADEVVEAPEVEPAPEVGDAPSETATTEPEQPQTVETETAAAPTAVAEPEASPLPEVDDGPSLGQAPEIEETETRLARADPDTVEAPAAEGEIESDTTTAADSLPRVEPEPVEEAPEVAEVEEPAEESAASETGSEADTGSTNRVAALPTVRRLGNDNEPTPETEPEVAETETVETDDVQDGAPALERYRMAFDNPDARPLMSIVLVHVGDGLPAIAELGSIPEGVAFAIDAGRSDAAELANAYRNAGREVVMIPSLPDGATPQDVEVAMRSNLETIPEAVAVMDGVGQSGIDRAAVAQIVDVVAVTGHGLVTFPRGLNTAYQNAGRIGVPAGLVFRDIDGDGQSADQIRRAMDRAAFKARQDDGVILVGRAQPDTVAALVEWSFGNQTGSVIIAPISATLLGQ